MISEKEYKAAMTANGYIVKYRGYYLDAYKDGVLVSSLRSSNGMVKATIKKAGSK